MMFKNSSVFSAKTALTAFMLIIFVSNVIAENYVAINSMDGRDVLSGIFYANVKGYPVKFVPYPTGNADLFALKVGSNHDILLIQSNSQAAGMGPVSTFIQGNLAAKNNTIQVYNSPDGGATNLDLATKSGAQGFIIVDSAYSDSALSVLPYAALKHYYVILADKNNAAQVKSIVQGKTVIIYGLVDSQVTAELASTNPQVIGTGDDKYEDNIAVSRKVMEEFNVNRALIVDGSFIEDAMTAGDQPIILTGSKLVPQVTENFIKEKVSQDKLAGVMLIGNALISPVYDMRERIKASLASEGMNKTFGITVKFAQVVPSSGTGTMVLDTFGLPAYKPNIELGDIVYNTQGNKVMVSVNNKGDGSAYYSVEVRVKLNGNDYKVLGGNQTYLIERAASGGLEFPVDLSAVQEGNITALVLVKYGASKNSLESFTSKEGPLTSISYSDTSNVSVKYARYDTEKKSMLVTIQNNGDKTAYSFTKLELIVDGQPTNVTGSGVKTLSPGGLAVEEYPLELTQSDLSANKDVTVFLDYGGRQGFLGNHAKYVIALERAEPFPWMLVIVGGIVLLIIIAALYWYGRKRDSKDRG